jgi:hypothetical protein
MGEPLFGELAYVGFSVEMPGASEASDQEIAEVTQPREG